MRIADIEEHLRQFRVGIAGAGGLGSNCAASLARAGIGTLVIADFDRVEMSNLSRQYFFTDQIGRFKTSALKENLLRIRPEINVIIHNIKLDINNLPVVFKGCDVIVEAFDKAEMKEMIVGSISTALPGVPVVIGSGLAGWGRNELIRSRKIDNLLYVCGDEESETSDELPPLAPRVAIVANFQANSVVEILMNKTSHPENL